MTTLTFQNTTLSVINQNNHTFLTSKDLGLALAYKNPTSDIMRIYDRNADEFTAEMTALIELQTAGGKQQVRVFSLRGAHLIAMFARTKVAKEFRKWVLDILDREILQNEQQISPLAEIEADEEALHIIVNLFHSLNGAYEMGEKIRKEHSYLAREIDKTIGGHYLYNLNGPTENALTKARKYVHAKSERIMFVKGMLSLLEEPKRIANF
ncbi:Bro-N domain-containing protein [Glaesserella parasuis]|uniref:BRO-N domain-containing protein n=1 Tax=Glaesserella parasuis TaxID=738 RepID=UPI001F25D94B|nr:Bro-N domain-containing protein [Glaesserella parasuis]MDG6335654.1 Bro-N domain-containing protein [Glaesserella parasuis]MDG6340431.1 Bro-N domain-containing protein [Glaesserella parasuis]MDG6429369.1 Bro-N domain-containing protein [Glaesserella parasuis]MDG6431681.1 Bro-N domain-containing protein [Glaesserella parasuis]MDG6446304.1 Bro-N domain-containing protein [Glaesserella parasuis]